MILSSVDELLSRVVHHPAVDTALDALRRGASEARLQGLTPSARAIVAAQSTAAMRRPTIVIVDSGMRAESMLEPLRYFLRAAGNESLQAVLLPGLDALPWGELPPHPEILETRALSLWRFVTGQAQVLLAPVSAAMLRYHAAESYAALAFMVERHAEVALEDLVRHLDATGYARAEMVEAAGQFAFRGGIVDVFPPEATRPVRIELLGDTVESIREFDPETQRSVSPVTRVALPPLLESTHAPSSAEEIDEAEEEGLRVEAWGKQTIFDLVARSLVILDEPSALDEAARKFADRIAESSAANGEEDAASRFALRRGGFQEEIARQQRLVLEQLSLEESGPKAGTIQTQSTTKYHGNITAFMAESRARISSGERVIVSAGTLGEIERLADLCHEYEMPYRLAEVDESAAGARLAEDSTAGSVPALVLARTPLTEGVAFPECRLTIYGTGDLFDTHAAGPSRPHAKTAKFFAIFRN